jgi:hypothetical protein
VPENEEVGMKLFLILTAAVIIGGAVQQAFFWWLFFHLLGGLKMRRLSVLFAAAALASSASAFDRGQYEGVDPAVRAWFKTVIAPSGVPCCDIADGAQVQWETTEEGYRVFIEREWVPVPPEAVVTNKGNPTGNAVVWYVRQSPTSIFIRCFVPGALL